MGERLERLYRRNPVGYVVFGMSFILGMILTSVAIALAMFARFMSLDASEHGLMILGASSAVTLGFGLATWLTARSDYLFSWPQRRIAPERAAEVWSNLADLAPRMIRRSIVVIALLVTPTLMLAGVAIGLDLAGQAALLVGQIATFLVAGLYTMNAYEVLLLPIRAELDSLLGDQVPEHAYKSGAGWRPALELLLVAVFSALLGAGFLSPPGQGPEALLLVEFGAIAASAPIVLVLGLFMTLRVQIPFAYLLETTRQVGAGDLSARVPLASVDEYLTLATSFNKMVAGLRQREALHSAVGAYIDPAIAERVAAEGAAISGEAADVTVMFVDIVGFTALAEGAVPDEVVSDLNDFFEVVVPAIERHGGHANKLLGDGLMAVFGVPSALDDHADRALAAAREIQQGLDDRYERELKAGIGLNSGTVVVGSMGGGRKLDYTIIGDAVNVAARVEAYTRQTGDEILLTDSTKALLSEPNGLVSRGSRELKGRTAPVELWAVEGAAR